MSLKLYYAPGACSFVPHSLLELVSSWKRASSEGFKPGVASRSDA